MLHIRNLAAGYAGGIVLDGLDLDVATGTVQALVGRNGAGKTTLMHVVSGLLRPYSGTVELDGVNLAGRPAHRIAREGIGLVPQGRRVFASLTVAEHLSLAAGSGRRRRWAANGQAANGQVTGANAGASVGRWSVPTVLDLLPRLAERMRHRGNQLSGGEQQMLAIARALLTQPRLLLLDEPCEGLSPELSARIRALVPTIASSGVAVLIVEQSAQHAATVTDQVARLDSGRIIQRSLAPVPRPRTAVPWHEPLGAGREPTLVPPHRR